MLSRKMGRLGGKGLVVHLLGSLLSLLLGFHALHICHDKHNDRKAPCREEMIYFTSTSHYSVSSKETKAETEAGTTEECCSLTCSSWLSHSVFL